MSVVMVNTKTLETGGSSVIKYYNENKGYYDAISGVFLPSCASFDTFKASLKSLFGTYTSHCNIMNDKLIECAEALVETDNSIGNSTTTSPDSQTLSNENDYIINNLNSYNISTYATSAQFSEELHKYLKLMKWNSDNPYNIKGIGGMSLYDVADITPEQMKAALDKIKANPGRDAIAKAAMLMIGTAADAGYKLNYRHAGTTANPHVPTNAVTNGGVDCNAYASWLIDKGVPGGLYWRRVEDFGSIGDPITDYSTAQCGDVFMTYTSDSQKHVGVIIENHPEEKYFITSESSDGIGFKVRTYAELQNSPGIKVRDLTNVYNGIYDANIDRYKFFSNSEQYSDTW